MTTGVGKSQADSECNERIPPDGFDMAALENCCPQSSLRGDVADFHEESSKSIDKTVKMDYNCKGSPTKNRFSDSLPWNCRTKSADVFPCLNKDTP